MGTINNNIAYRRFTTAEVRIRLLVDTATALVHTALHDGPPFLQPLLVGRSGSPTNGTSFLKLDGRLSSGRRFRGFGM